MRTADQDGAVYVGHVMHMRLRPKAHRFRYRLFSLLLDVDRLAETTSRLRLLSLNGRGVLSFHERDHGPCDGSPLRPWAEARLAEAGRPRPARIRLLALPRVLGYAFNPLSIYFCEDADGRLESVIHEVRNTFGGRIAYVHSANGTGIVRHARRKEMFVSPFIGMDQTYRFDLAPPGERLSIRIKQGDADGDLLIATQTGRRRPLTDAALARLLITHPLVTFKVIAAIHWQALRLLLKGAPFRRPPAKARAPVDDITGDLPRTDLLA